MNELEALQQQLDELLAVLQRVLESGEVLSDEFMGVIAENIQYLVNRIGQVRAGETGEVPETPAVEPGPFPSSNIFGFKYDPDKQELLVQFQDQYPGTDGPQYLYQGVPPGIVEIFGRGAIAPKTSGENEWHRWEEGVTPSLGASMIALISSRDYPYERVR